MVDGEKVKAETRMGMLCHHLVVWCWGGGGRGKGAAGLRALSCVC